MRLRFDIAIFLFIFIEILYVYFPGLITVVGDAGTTPPEHMGLYALTCFAAPIVVMTALRRTTKPIRWARWFGTTAIATRVALQFTPGGWTQMTIVTIGLVAALLYLALATRFTPLRTYFTALMVALAAHVTLTAVWAGPNLVWRDGTLATSIILAVCSAAIIAVTTTDLRIHLDHAPSYLAFGPALFLLLLHGANLHFVVNGSGRAQWWEILLIVTVAWTSVYIVGFKHEIKPGPWLWGGILILAVTATGIGGHLDAPSPLTDSSALLAALSYVALAFLGNQLAVLDRNRDQKGSQKSGTYLLAGTLVFATATFVYYAAYDLGYDNWPTVTAVAVVIVAVAQTSWRRSREAQPHIELPVRRRVLVLATASLTVLVLTTTYPSGSRETVSVPESLRIAAYNIQMGFDLDGRYALAQQAKTLRELDPDIVMLSEVDRGWMLNGGQDSLRNMADSLEMNFYWAPAADRLWGDAILTNLPLTSYKSHALAPGGPTGAQALEANVRWGNDDLTLISTHLQPPYNEEGGWSDTTQARQVRDLADAAMDKGHKVIMAGDFNFAPQGPSSEAWKVVTGSETVDAFADWRPFPTTPGEGEAVQIDHVFLSPDLTPSNPANPNVEHSDHRPIAVTVR
ncbi:endonuclease/exonuclease/phosphatase family protein [Haloglycomyces albus]|uniref:endonuclease/exonuclease/phosphatase family protein n=1 Tax=Haloglycomyces albus TaxID=526067 RepID=UPI00046CF969|nr:endonuclease/exonuclease/phosphatase family protein [Haloglycomyces albus]